MSFWHYSSLSLGLLYRKTNYLIRMQGCDLVPFQLLQMLVVVSSFLPLCFFLLFWFVAFFFEKWCDVGSKELKPAYVMEDVIT